MKEVGVATPAAGYVAAWLAGLDLPTLINVCMAIYAIGLAVRTIYHGLIKARGWYSRWSANRYYRRGMRKIAKARERQRGAANPRVLQGLLAACVLIAGGIAAHEGRKFHAYQDTGGTWTICEGSTRNVHEGDTATPAQCNERKLQDMAYAARSIASCLRVELPPNQYAAYLDFEFNTGKFCGSSMERRANAGDQRGACQAIGLYMYVAGKDCRLASSNCAGIVKRRKAEIALCWPDFGNVESGAMTA